MRRNRMATLRIFARPDAVCTPGLTMLGPAPEHASLPEGAGRRGPGACDLPFMAMRPHLATTPTPKGRSTL
jgi:hypothetical protein